MKLYCCFSLYHVYITLLKNVANKEKTDIIIGTQMPNYEQIINKLDKVEYINKIYCFDSISYKNLTYKGIVDKFFNMKKKEIAYIDEKLSINWDQYKDNIYIYNDFEILGWYFVDRKINYHLIEDGLNFFTYFNNYYNIELKNYNLKSIKNKIKNLFNIGHRPYGISNYAIDIEVNKIDGIVINKDKVFEVPRKDLSDKLDKKQKKLLYSIFCKDDKLQMNCDSKNTILLCTQPLFYDGQLKDITTQGKVYSDIIKEYSNKGYHITIKPHPRDDYDYTDICNKYECLYIDRYIPSEILNYDDTIRYGMALSITTTAIESLEFVNERKYLGFEFLEGYKK